MNYDYIESIRYSSKAVINNNLIEIDQEALYNLVKSISLESFNNLKQSHGYKLPLKFNSIDDELTILGLLSILNFGSGYRLMFHHYTGRGAFDNIKRFILGLYLNKDNGCLETNFMINFNLDNAIDYVGFSPFEEKPHPTLPGVIVGERDAVAVEFLQLLTDTINEIGNVLKKSNKLSFGHYLRELFESTSDVNKIIDIVSALYFSFEYHSSNQLRQLTKDFNTLDDKHCFKLNNGSSVEIKLYKKCLILIETIRLHFKERGQDLSFNLPNVDNVLLPIFSDNVIPSMLLHWQVLKIKPNDYFSDDDKQMFNHSNEELENFYNVLKDEKKDDKSDNNHDNKVNGPLFNRDQTSIIRSAAVEVVRLLSLESGIGTEVEIDAFIWSIAKRNQFRKLIRFSERNTTFY